MSNSDYFVVMYKEESNYCVTRFSNLRTKDDNAFDDNNIQLEIGDEVKARQTTNSKYEDAIIKFIGM